MSSSEQPGLDAHAKPPDDLRVVFKKCQHMRAADIEADASIIDFARGPTEHQEKALRGEEPYEEGYLNTVFDPFVGRPTRGVNNGVRRYESLEIPGKAT